jgi:hypothetical protein
MRLPFIVLTILAALLVGYVTGCFIGFDMAAHADLPPLG